MITATLLGLLGIALAAVIVAIVRGPKRAAAPIAAPAQPAAVRAAHNPLELEAWDARRGDIISVTGAAEDFSDLDFPVDRRSAYESTNGRWIALSGDFRGRRVFLETWRFPSPRLIGFFDSQSYSIAEVGLTEDQLIDFDTRQDPSATFLWNNATWTYESSREISYLENETAPPVGLYRWLFNEQHGTRVLCVEKWETEPFRIRIARKLENRNVTVYRAA